MKRSVHAIIVAAAAEEGLLGHRAGRNQDRCHLECMAGFVEVLQVKCVIPDLIDRSAVELRLTYLELDHEDDVINHHHRIDPLAYTRHHEFEKEVATPPEGWQGFLEQSYLIIPGIALSQVDRELAGVSEPPDDLSGQELKELVDRGRKIGARYATSWYG